MLHYDRDTEVICIRFRDDEIDRVIEGVGRFYIAINKKGEVIFVEIHVFKITK